MSVAVAAGVSWPVFGAVLLLLSRARPSVLAWADACLRTMAPGILVLAAAALLGRAGIGGRALVLVTVAVSNLTMLAVFLPQARRLGLAPAKAAAAWLLVLDGFFALVVWWWAA